MMPIIPTDDVEVDWDSMNTGKVSNSKEQFGHRRREPILNKTKGLLEQFFRHFNQDLAFLLKDDRFLWNK
jgi:hypothetical protein